MFICITVHKFVFMSSLQLPLNFLNSRLKNQILRHEDQDLKDCQITFGKYCT